MKGAGMKRSTAIVFLAMGFAAFLFCPCCTAQEASNDYIWVCAVTGHVTFRTDHGQDDVHIMERIRSNTILTILEGTSVSLCRAGYRPLTLTHVNSPYTVNEASFERDSSISSTTIDHLSNAFRDYSDFLSIPGDSPIVFRPSVKSKFPAIAHCQQNIWPVDDSPILYLASVPLDIMWNLKERHFTLRIHRLDTKEMVYEKNLAHKKVAIPMTVFKAGVDYEWVIEEKTSAGCYSTFRLADEDETAAVMRNLAELCSNLPAEASEETCYRIQAGYLYSEEFRYDALHLLEQHGITSRAIFAK
jgi:hypothetical protein